MFLYSSIRYSLPPVLLSYFLIVCCQPVAGQSRIADSAIVRASQKYDQPKLLVRLILGSNYRRDWDQPVKMEILKLSAINGGLRIVALGGGHQTKSLQLEAKDGEEFVLRTVDKNVANVLPHWLRKTPAKGVAQEFVSAAEPYAPLVVAPLADAVHISAAHPKLFYVPDDPGFGKYRADFAGKVCFLEERTPLRPGTKYVSMKQVLEDQQSRAIYNINQKQVLRARLLDMLIADWDRHQGQWKWGMVDSAGKKYLYAVPVDRDQAFFHTNGLVPWVAANTLTPYLTGFRKNIGNLSRFNDVAKNIDKLFLNSLSEADWRETITDVQRCLTDSVIEYAVSKLPPEISKKTGRKIILKLKSRRDALLSAGMRYYRKLANTVYIIGSDSPERFELKTNNDGLMVSIYTLNDNRLLYSRLFQSRDTKKIYLVDTQENDIIKREPESKGQIKLLITKGKDSKKNNVRQRVLHRLIKKQGGQ
jgi:hypothetical protein